MLQNKTKSSMFKNNNNIKNNINQSSIYKFEEFLNLLISLNQATKEKQQ